MEFGEAVCPPVRPPAAAEAVLMLITLINWTASSFNCVSPCTGCTFSQNSKTDELFFFFASFFLHLFDDFSYFADYMLSQST